MKQVGGQYSATIPADYTDSHFHLQYFISGTQAGNAVLTPGLDADLANEPYYTALHG